MSAQNRIRCAPQEVGSAAGLLDAVRQLGGTLGVAALGSAYLHGSALEACLAATGLLVATLVTALAMRD